MKHSQRQLRRQMQSEANARCSTAHASQNISPRISQGNIIYASTNMNRSKCYIITANKY